MKILILNLSVGYNFQIRMSNICTIQFHFGVFVGYTFQIGMSNIYSNRPSLCFIPFKLGWVPSYQFFKERIKGWIYPLKLGWVPTDQRKGANEKYLPSANHNTIDCLTLYFFEIHLSLRLSNQPDIKVKISKNVFLKTYICKCMKKKLDLQHFLHIFFFLI